MQLHPRAREYYVVQIDTVPALAGWEASFDGGTTWRAGELVAGTTNRWRWLLAGPTFDPAGAPALGGATVTTVPATTSPLLRATDAPAVVVSDGPVVRVG